jgi:hypothetical protein
MRRAFFCGLTFALILIGLGLALLGHVALSRPASVAAGIVSLAVACISLFMARRAPPIRSWLLAVCGCLLGYAAAIVLLVPIFSIFGHQPH